jgi:hypothetical protein
MGRHHKKSKKNVIQVNPDATLNYITGILTGASNYITGILEGANLYNSWVQTEMALEGKPIGEYKEDALRKFLQEFKNKDYDGYVRFMSDPYGFIKELKEKYPANYDRFINDILTGTNYGRLYNTDKYMIEAGKNYREQIPSLLKSKNIETGLTMLENYAPFSAKVIDKINGIMTSAIKYNG